MKTIRQLARRGTPLFTASWLLFVLLTALQPCCDTIAEASPHRHEPLSHSVQDHHASVQNDGHDHRHCDIFDQWQGSEFFVVVSETAQPETPDFIPVSVVDTTPVSPVSHASQHQMHPWRAQASPPVFLITQRLRI